MNGKDFLVFFECNFFWTRRIDNISDLRNLHHFPSFDKQE